MFAWLMKFLRPLSRQPPSALTARVLMAFTSEPAPGSVSPNATIFSPAAMAGSQSLFCSALPNRLMGVAPKHWTPTIIEHAGLTRATCSTTTHTVTSAPSMPPYSSGTATANKSSPRNSSATQAGNSARSSISRVRGATCSTISPRTISAMDRCSSEKVKSIIAFCRSSPARAAAAAHWTITIPQSTPLGSSSAVAQLPAG